MNLRPIGDRLIVKTEYERGLRDGVFLSDKGYGKPVRGTVIAVGTGHRNKDGVLIKPDVNVGETLGFSLIAGIEFKEKEEYYRILDVDEISFRETA